MNIIDVSGILLGFVFSMKLKKEIRVYPDFSEIYSVLLTIEVVLKFSSENLKI